MVTDYERAVETLWKDVKDLRSDLKAVLGSLHEHAREKVDFARERVREHAHERIRDAADAASNAGRRAIMEVKSVVEERPLASLLTAIGVGMVIGTLIHWRYHR